MSILDKRVVLQIPVDTKDWQNILHEVRWPTKSHESGHQMLAEMLNWGASTSLTSDNISIGHFLIGAMQTREQPSMKVRIGVWAPWPEIAKIVKYLDSLGSSRPIEKLREDGTSHRNVSIYEH